MIVLVSVLLVLPGCGTSQPLPTLERIEQILAVSMPDGAKVIGGNESPESSLWLIVSSKPLPLPTDTESKLLPRTRQEGRSQGTPFPVSALANLMAANGVLSDEVPRLTDEHGISHIGEVRDVQFTYRVGRTEHGWLTAVEIQTTEISGTQAVTD